MKYSMFKIKNLNLFKLFKKNKDVSYLVNMGNIWSRYLHGKKVYRVQIIKKL